MAFISCNDILDHGATGVFMYRVLFSECLDHECGAKWVGVVRDDGAGTAHLHRLNSAVNTTAAVKGRGVDRALWGGLSAQSDVAVLTPGCAPRVLDQPEVSLLGVSSVANKGDGVVDNHVRVVVTSIEDSTTVGAPVRGGHRGREGTPGGEVVHKGGGVVVGESFEAHGHHSGVRGGRVKLADIIVSSASTCIRIVVFSDNSEERSVGVGQRLNGAHAATSASALKRVWNAADKMLGAQFNQVVGHVVDLCVGSQNRGGGKSPTGSASPLIPHHGDDTLVPPVNRLGKISYLCLVVLIVDRLAWSS